jgi:carbon-monoxide dehydrogenase medium subunit
MELIEHEAFAKAWPGVIDGIKLIGSIQVKGRATLGGNLCNASPAADSVPALIAAEALASIAGPNGKREVRVEDIATGPGKTSLAKGEIVTSFLLPRRLPHSGDAYLRFTPRTEMDIAVVGVSVNLTLDESGLCRQARVSLGAVADRALLVPEAAAALIGSRIDAAALEDLAAAASAACRPIDDKRGTKEFRIKVACVMARRAAEIALARAKGKN